LYDLAELPQPQHVEGDVQDAEMDQDRGDEAPPLAASHFRQAGVDIVGDQERPQRVEVGAEPRVQRDQHAHADQREGETGHVAGRHVAVAGRARYSGEVISTRSLSPRVTSRPSRATNLRPSMDFLYAW